MPQNNTTLGFESLAVVLGSSLAGAVTGFLLGFVTFGGPLLTKPWHTGIEGLWMPVMLGFAGAIVGALVTLVVGPILYFTLLRGHLTWRRFTLGFLVCVVANLPFALVGLGILCVFTMPGIALWLAVFIRLRSVDAALRPSL